MEATINLSPKQSQAWKALESPQINELLYGGAKGGGKSVFGCYWMYLKCLEIIEKFKMTIQKYPPAVGFMGRKQGVDFTDTTLETWKRFIPGSTYEIRSGDKEIIVGGAVKIQYGGFDDTNTIKKFNSAEYGIGFVDQAEELTRDDYGLFKGTLRLKIDNQELPYKLLLTANPAICWLKDEFITSPTALMEEKAFIQALPSDNPYLHARYISTLKDAFKHRPELIQAYVYGSWDEIAGGDLIIQYSWGKAAVCREVPMKRGKVVVSCDPARFGDDETVIYVMEDNQVKDTLIYGQKDEMFTCGKLKIFKEKYNAQIIAVDTTGGYGGGIVDRLREMGEPTLEINYAAKASTEERQIRYRNLRAEMYWEAGKLFYEGMCSIPDDQILLGQLTSIKHQGASNGTIQVEPKDAIKKRLNRSPDRADAYVQGLWALTQVHDQRFDYHRDEDNPLQEAAHQGEYQDWRY